MAQKYTRTISSHFPGLTGTKINGGALKDQIHADSDITIAVDHINSKADGVDIWMKVAISAGEETALDAVCAVHTGEPTIVPTQVNIANTLTRGGKLVFTQSAIPSNLDTILVGAGDDLSPTPPASGVAEGAKIYLTFTVPATKEQDIRFSEPINIAGGDVYWEGAWELQDMCSFGAVLPATVVTANGGGTGNCTLYDLGGYNAILPAAGDGDYDVDLAAAVPVPDPDKAGYWDVDQDTGVVTVSTKPGAAKYLLLDIQAAHKRLLHNVPMNASGVLNVRNLQLSEWVHQNWILRIEIVKASAGSGNVAGMLQMYRKTTTV